MRWQLCNIRWMEIQVHSIHGHTRSYLPNTNGESWASNNCNSRVTAHSRSQYNTRRRTLDTARSKSQIRPHHHYYSSSSNSGQTTSPSNGTWGIQATMSQDLTKLLKPTFDHNNFEESFSNWEFELQRYEADNTTRLPDQVKIAVLMNETRGPLQQHLHLNAGTAPTYAAIRATIMEYYRTTMALTRLHQQSSAVSSNLGGGTAPMDIGATCKGKGKGKNNSKGNGATDTKATEWTTKEKEKASNNGSQYNKPKETKEKERTKDNTKEKERIQCQVVTLWSTWTCGKRLQDNSLQCVWNTTGTGTGWNRSMVWPTKWIWSILV